jgi:hypothetical protein
MLGPSVRPKSVGGVTADPGPMSPGGTGCCGGSSERHATMARRAAASGVERITCPISYNSLKSKTNVLEPECAAM